MSIKIIEIGNNLNIVFNEKKFTLNKKNVNLEILYKIAFLYNQKPSTYLENKLIKILPPLKKEKDGNVLKNRIEKNLLIRKLKSITKNTSWNIKEGKILLGKDFYLPTEFVEYLHKAQENNEDVTAYKLFIEKLANNPVEHVRDNFFTYMQDCQLKLTPSGNILAYRYVETIANQEYNLTEVKEITQLYFKYKLQKKAPSKYEYKGRSLQEAFDSIEEVFTDNYSKKQKYKVGDIIEMPLEEADTSSRTCSRGFHFTNFKGIFNLPYDFGKVLVLGIINPSKIVSIPGDSYPKFRCIEWYFAGVIDESFVEEIEYSDISVLDMDFNSKEELKHSIEDPFKMNGKIGELKKKLKALTVKKVEEKKPITIITSL